MLNPEFEFPYVSRCMLAAYTAIGSILHDDEVLALDAGYCLDAPDVLPGGSVYREGRCLPGYQRYVLRSHLQ